MRFWKWTTLATIALVLSTSTAEAFGRRGRRGCNGGNGCHSSYHGCSRGVVHSGCHGGCHGCSGSAYRGGRGYYAGGAYYGNGMSSTAPSVRYSGYGAEQVAPPKKAGGAQFQENGDLEGGAVLNFRAPQGAQIWVDGQLVNRTGADWRWTSPALQEGQRRSVEVRARWMENGRETNQTRTINLQRGATTVDFTRPETRQDSQPGAQPERRQDNQQNQNPQLQNNQQNRPANSPARPDALPQPRQNPPDDR